MIIRDLIDYRISIAASTDPADAADVAALVDEVAGLVDSLDTAGWTRHASTVAALNADLHRGLDATPRAAALKALTDGLTAIRADVVAPAMGLWTLGADEWPADGGDADDLVF